MASVNRIIVVGEFSFLDRLEMLVRSHNDWNETL
jgi:hypothetical protein